MKHIIIRKTQYSIGLLFPSILILLITTESSIAKNVPPLELSLPIITSQFLGSSANKNKDNPILSVKPLGTLQPLHSLQKTNKNSFSHFQDRYLTYHYGKHERIKANYEQGAYYITYQQEW